MAEDSPFTVDADWLQKRLGEPGLTIVDASWYLPAQKRDARAEYDAAHIPGARFLDQDAISDPDSALPHTLPSPQHFAQYVGAMGISADDTIVVYDGPGFFSAPRAWWMFRVMGVFQIYVLDGGFDRWKAAGRPVTAELSKDRLRKVIEDAGIDLSKPVVTSCGSGVTAAAITLALETLGHTDNRLYDGSWTEWGGLSDTPVVTGKDRQ
ncbi:MAG: sulfurtransferase [Mesorhizobium sp.]|nr:MAG: sulfurtransferase [Mesorhizobium sp.]